MLTYQKKADRGFTLIELLVVISIIGLLSVIVLSSLNTARAKARDARRIADLIQVRNALELYYADNGKYPLSPSTGVNTDDVETVYDNTLGTPIVGNSSWKSGFGAPTDLESQLNSPKVYIKTLPRDPRIADGGSQGCIDGLVCSLENAGTGYGYGYVVNYDGSKYELMAQLELSNPQDCAHGGSKYNLRVRDIWTGANPGTANYCVDLDGAGVTYDGKLFILH